MIAEAARIVLDLRDRLNDENATAAYNAKLVHSAAIVVAAIIVSAHLKKIFEIPR